MTTEKTVYHLDQCAVFGRTLAEYTAYFNLDGLLPGHRFLDIAGGSASFTAEVRALGYHARAVDPAYTQNARALRLRVQADFAQCIRKLHEARSHFVGDDRQLVEKIAQRQRAMDTFLADFPAGRATGAYLGAALPDTGLETGAADYVLCGHCLFLYGHLPAFSPEFHVDALRELARLATLEARIYPVIQMNGQPYPELDHVREELAKVGIASELRRVDYEFLRGANQMLVLHGK